MTNAPANGLNSKTIPKATACVEKMMEKFLFHLLSCHGNYGLGSPYGYIGTDFLTGYFYFYFYFYF